jgi:K+-transporting ATPase ATPase C chain
MFQMLKQAVLATIAIMLLCGLGYPLAMTGLAEAIFPSQAHGSLIERDGKTVGSALIGQNFTGPEYFHPRPSAITAPDPKDPTKTVPTPYDASNSNASNASPTGKGLVSDVSDRVAALKKENPDAAGSIPVDLVTSSGSGLDPDISPAAANYQAPRVAAARSIPVADVDQLVAKYTQPRVLGILGEARVNVLRLNLALDELHKKSP